MDGSDNSASKTNKTTLFLRTSRRDGGMSDGTSKKAERGRSEIEKTRESLISALKILSMASLAGDDVSEEFFSSYERYSDIACRLHDMGILSEDVPLTKSAFDINPPDCWMKVILAIFTALHAFPDNSGIFCDVITSSDVGNDAVNRDVGVYFSTTLRLEAYDWNEHKVDLYIPSSGVQRMLFIIDEEPMLYTIVGNDPK